ncbi:MAG: hypothetical protein PHV53_10965 [Fermentimonas sp.]|nr:hypothetical protein [Fermentimonas sp.]
MRNGRMPKWQRIQKEVQKATSIEEAYEILERFNLTNSEECQIAQSWQREQMILKVHGKGTFTQVVAA